MNSVFSTPISEMEKKFDFIKKSKAALFSFFSMMPKGGNLHHHFSNMSYAEAYINFLMKQDFYINVRNFVILVSLDNIREEPSNYVKFKELSASELMEYKLHLMKIWDTKEFYDTLSKDLFFFSIFGQFDLGRNNNDYHASLQTLKTKALNQNISYMESMFLYCQYSLVQEKHASALNDFNEKLVAFNEKLKHVAYPYPVEIITEFNALAHAIYDTCKTEIIAAANAHNEKVKQALGNDINDENFVIKFQNFVFRNQNPIDVFISLAASFHSSSTSSDINGVNIVSAENAENALKFYDLHLLFYRFFEKKYPKETYALQAGELSSASVGAEYLGTHVRKTLMLRNLRRIAHGLDIVYDRQVFDTLMQIQNRNEISKELQNYYDLNFDINYLEKSHIENKPFLAFECNFTSNEYLFNLKPDMHPVSLFSKYNIPVVICSDDEGIISTNITEQFVTLTYTHDFTYKEIKKMCFDSIRYANIKDLEIKKKLFAKLLHDFEVFENSVDDFINGFPARKTAQIGFAEYK